MEIVPKMNRANALKAWEADLRKSNLTIDEVKKRGWKLQSPKKTRELTKTNKYAGTYAWSYLIVYKDINHRVIKNYWRVRYLEKILGKFGNPLKKQRRYTGPKGAKLRVYLDPTVDYSAIRAGD